MRLIKEGLDKTLGQAGQRPVLSMTYACTCINVHSACGENA